MKCVIVNKKSVEFFFVFFFFSLNFLDLYSCLRCPKQTPDSHSRQGRLQYKLTSSLNVTCFTANQYPQ